MAGCANTMPTTTPQVSGSLPILAIRDGSSCDGDIDLAFLRK